MPLVRISMKEGRSIEQRRAIADCIHKAMVETLGVPADDRFQVVTEYSSAGTGSDLIYDAHYLASIGRTESSLFRSFCARVERTR